MRLCTYFGDRPGRTRGRLDLTWGKKLNKLIPTILAETTKKRVTITEK